MSSRLARESESRRDLKGLGFPGVPRTPASGVLGWRRAVRPLPFVIPDRPQPRLRGEDEVGICFSRLFFPVSELSIKRGAASLAPEVQPSPRTVLLQGGPCVLL